MIRPFQLGDLYLIQRLSRQATRFFTVHTLLHSHSVVRSALESVIPLGDARALTYVLRQEGHGLVRGGVLQVQKRSGGAAADVLCLSPGLEAADGHPAIWTKLLAYYLHDVLQQGVERIYIDVSDQTLPVSTVTSVGFLPYSRHTIWRLFTPPADCGCPLRGVDIRPYLDVDEWALARLYERVAPAAIQHAEGWPAADRTLPPILSDWIIEQGETFVLVEKTEICGALQIATGHHGSWLQLWVDWLRPDQRHVRQLLAYGFSFVRRSRWQTPIYTAVADYQGGMDVLLAEMGFAPFSDRVKLVKHVVKRVREAVKTAAPAIETVNEGAPTTFAPPDTVRSGAPPALVHSSSGNYP